MSTKLYSAGDGTLGISSHQIAYGPSFISEEQILESLDQGVSSDKSLRLFDLNNVTKFQTLSSNGDVTVFTDENSFSYDSKNKTDRAEIVTTLLERIPADVTHELRTGALIGAKWKLPHVLVAGVFGALFVFITYSSDGQQIDSARGGIKGVFALLSNVIGFPGSVLVVLAVVAALLLWGAITGMLGLTEDHYVVKSESK